MLKVRKKLAIDSVDLYKKLQPSTQEATQFHAIFDDKEFTSTLNKYSAGETGYRNISNAIFFAHGLPDTR